MFWVLDLEPVSTSGQPAPVRCSYICQNNLRYLVSCKTFSGDPPLRPDQRQWHSHFGLLGRAGQLCGSWHSQRICPGNKWGASISSGAVIDCSYLAFALCNFSLGNLCRLKYSLSQIWDVAAAKRVNVLSGHSARWEDLSSDLVFPHILQPWSVEFHLCSL